VRGRGRKVGELQNQRDERGWMIPRAGTRRRAVYDALVAGGCASEICATLSLSRRAFDSHKAYIARWGKVQRWRRASSEVIAA
jgi:FixJ family two-component response regulator